jgi:hypothetical protein
MGIHLIEMKVKPLPLGLLVMRIEQVIGVIRSFYQTKVMAGLNNVSCCSRIDVRCNVRNRSREVPCLGHLAQNIP